MLKAFAVYLPGTAIPQVLMFLMTVVAAKSFPAATYGLFAFVVFVGELIEYVFTSWLRVVLVRESRLEGTGVTRGTAWLCLAIIAALIPVYAVIVTVVLFASSHQAGAPLFLSAMAYIVSICSVRISLSLLQVMDRERFYSLSETARAILVFVVALAYMSSFQNPLGLVTVISLANGLAALFSWKYVFKVSKSGSRSLSLAAIARHGGALLSLSAMNWCVINLDRYILQAYLGLSAFAGYNLVATIIRQIYEVLASSYNTASFGRLAGPDGAEKGVEEKVFSMHFSLLLSVLVPLAFGICLFGSDLVHLLFSPNLINFGNGVFVLLTAGISAMAMKRYMFDNILLIRRRTDAQFYGLLFGAVIGLIASWVLIPIFAETGAAAAMFLGSAASMSVSLVMSRREVRFKLNRRMGAACAVYSSVQLIVYVGMEKSATQSWGVLGVLAFLIPTALVGFGYLYVLYRVCKSDFAAVVG